MKFKEETKVRNIFFIAIIIVCVLALSYGVYYQVFIKNAPVKVPEVPVVMEDVGFTELFDNTLHTQDYNTTGFTSRLDPNKDIIYTAHTMNESFDGKYDISSSIPIININHPNVINIDREITSVFYNKINDITSASSESGSPKTIYTVSYSAYLNENILSLVIRSTLKEGNNAQRVIIKGYNYNLSTNQLVSLEDVLAIQGKSITSVETKINETIQNAIDYSDRMALLGYEVYKRDIKSNLYKVANSDNFMMGPNGSIYIIYAYGNNSFTTENDIVYIK